VTKSKNNKERGFYFEGYFASTANIKTGGREG